MPDRRLEPQVEVPDALTRRARLEAQAENGCVPCRAKDIDATDRRQEQRALMSDGGVGPFVMACKA